MNIKQLAELLEISYDKEPFLELKGLLPANEAKAAYVSLGFSIAKEKRPNLLKEAIWILDEPCDNLPYVLVYPSFKKALRLVTSFFKPKDVIKAYRSDFADIHQDAILGSRVHVDSFTKIGAGVHIGDNSYIASQVSIGAKCKIGEGCVIHPGVVLYEGCELGNHVILHSGSVIGSDGFGYSREETVWKKIEHLGRVVIEDDVEIGANSCIDRATIGETRIKKGVKLDNLVQVAHNVEIGNHSLCVSQSGFSGSVVTGDHVIIGGQVGMADHVCVGSHAVVFSRAGVTKNVLEGQVVAGFPAQDKAKDLQEQVVIKRLVKEFQDKRRKKNED